MLGSRHQQTRGDDQFLKDVKNSSNQNESVFTKMILQANEDLGDRST